MITRSAVGRGAYPKPLGCAYSQHSPVCDWCYYGTYYCTLPPPLLLSHYHTMSFPSFWSCACWSTQRTHTQNHAHCMGGPACREKMRMLHARRERRTAVRTVRSPIAGSLGSNEAAAATDISAMRTRSAASAPKTQNRGGGSSRLHTHTYTHTPLLIRTRMLPAAAMHTFCFLQVQKIRSLRVNFF